MQMKMKIKVPFWEASNPPEIATPLKFAVIAPLLSMLERRPLRYTDPGYLYQCICLGDEHFCGVFGDGPNGAYEWFLWGNGKLETSDAGYGSPEAALRDVLNKAA